MSKTLCAPGDHYFYTDSTGTCACGGKTLKEFALELREVALAARGNSRVYFLNHLAGVREDKPHPRSTRPDLPLVGTESNGRTPLTLPGSLGTNDRTREVYAWASQSNRPNRA
jgi:hypothetical protein